MTTLSIGRAWTETSAFVNREAGLLLPVALLFIAVPLAVVFQLVPPDLRAQVLVPRVGQETAQMPVAMLVAMFATMLIVLIGGLALYALALRPGISVGEALQLALRRSPVLVGAQFLLGFLLALPMLLLGAVAPAATSLILVVAFALYNIRLITLNALVADTQLGIIDSIKASWVMSRGHFWRLAAFWLIMMSLVMLAMIVVQSIFGLIGYAIAGKPGSMTGGELGSAVVIAISQVYIAVMTSRVYRQLDEQ